MRDLRVTGHRPFPPELRNALTLDEAKKELKRPAEGVPQLANDSQQPSCPCQLYMGWVDNQLATGFRPGWWDDPEPLEANCRELWFPLSHSLSGVVLLGLGCAVLWKELPGSRLPPGPVWPRVYSTDLIQVKCADVYFFHTLAPPQAQNRLSLRSIILCNSSIETYPTYNPCGRLRTVTHSPNVLGGW